MYLSVSMCVLCVCVCALHCLLLHSMLMLMLMLMLILMLVSLLLVWLIDTPIALSQSVCLVHLIVATVWHRRHSLCSLLWPSDCVRQRLIVAHSGKWSSDHWSEQWSQTVTDRHSFWRMPIANGGIGRRSSVGLTQLAVCATLCHYILTETNWQKPMPNAWMPSTTHY